MKPVNPVVLFRRWLDEAKAVSVQCTLDRRDMPAVRLHLVPPLLKGMKRPASILHINGQHMLPLSHGLATLLRYFMLELTEVATPGGEIEEEALEGVLDRTSQKMHFLYPEQPVERFAQDLGRLQDIIFRIAGGEYVPELENHELSLAEYARHMRAPIRMDLAVSPMVRNGIWVCPNNCQICYAADGEAMEVTSSEELTAEEWEQVIDILWASGVVQLNFTGGDPLMRRDLPRLVRHARQFTTRVNTSAVILTRDMARRLHDAELDAMQVTVYSVDPTIHDALVGREGALARTLNGIRFALEAGIEVSVNTPLVQENFASYGDTLQWLHNEMGIRYFTASGMLPAGGAIEKMELGGGVPQSVLFAAMKHAKKVAEKLGCELDFTSPGCLSDAQLLELDMNPPACGACLGNMAVAPDGEVLPCQSWVLSKKSLGNILQIQWDKIWNHPMCNAIRQQASLKNECPLHEINSEE